MKTILIAVLLACPAFAQFFGQNCKQNQSCQLSSVTVTPGGTCGGYSQNGWSAPVLTNGFMVTGNTLTTCGTIYSRYSSDASGNAAITNPTSTTAGLSLNNAAGVGRGPISNGRQDFNPTGLYSVMASLSGNTFIIDTQSNILQSFFTATRTLPGAVFAAMGHGLHPAHDGYTVSILAGEETNGCPIFDGTYPNIGTGAATTVACTDAAAGGNVPPATSGRRGYRTFNTTAAAGSASFLSTGAFVKGLNAPKFCTQIRTGSNITSVRMWSGLFSIAPGASDTGTGFFMAFRYSTAAGDTTWQMCSRNNVTTSCSDTGQLVAVDTNYLLCADSQTAPTGPYYVSTRGPGADLYVVTASFQDMSAGNLFVHHSVEALSASARTLGFALATVDK